MSKKSVDLTIGQKYFWKSVMVFILIITLVFFLIHHIFKYEAYRFKVEDMMAIKIVFAAIFLSFPIHEFIHYLSFFYFIGQRKSKFLKFGFSWEYIMPYCTFSRLIWINQYRVITIMPFIVLCVLPLIISIFYKSNLLMFFSFISGVACVGDIAILWKIRKYKKDAYIKDHPKKPGCIVYQ